jgi:hypothetical protein
VKELETRRHVTRSEEQESAAKILERPYDTVVSYPIMTKKGKKLGNCRGRKASRERPYAPRISNRLFLLFGEFRPFQ